VKVHSFKTCLSNAKMLSRTLGIFLYVGERWRLRTSATMAAKATTCHINNQTENGNGSEDLFSF
jgi:hypothetical protein